MTQHYVMLHFRGLLTDNSDPIKHQPKLSHSPGRCHKFLFISPVTYNFKTDVLLQNLEKTPDNKSRTEEASSEDIYPPLLYCASLFRLVRQNGRMSTLKGSPIA